MPLLIFPSPRYNLQREVPAVEHIVEVIEVFGSSDGRFFRVSSFVDPPVDQETIFLAVLEMNCHGATGFASGEGMRVETAFDECHIDEILGKAVFSQERLHHGMYFADRASQFMNLSRTVV